jgi:hypothetical protein
MQRAAAQLPWCLLRPHPEGALAQRVRLEGRKPGLPDLRSNMPISGQAEIGRGRAVRRSRVRWPSVAMPANVLCSVRSRGDAKLFVHRLFVDRFTLRVGDDDAF